MVLCTSRSRSSVRSVCVNIFRDTPSIARRSSPCRLAPFANSYRTRSPHLVQMLVKMSWTLTTARRGVLGNHLGGTSLQGTYLNGGRLLEYTDPESGRECDATHLTTNWRITSGPRLDRRALMVELILSEAQLACLRAAVTVGSEESAALGRGTGLGAKLFSPEPFAVKCTREIADRLLAVARRSCPDVVPEIRAAIEQERV
jgi:hypothetical protein